VKIWVDTQLVEATSDHLDAKNWPLGSGIFETVRTENGSAQLLSRHMRRALASARELAIIVPDQELILSAIDQLLLAEAHDVGKLRLCFSKGRFLATHESYSTESLEYNVTLGVRAEETSARQHKLFPYGSRLDLLKSAVDAGCDEVILLDQDNRVCEGAVSNYLFRINGQWQTPPITAGILPGVIRALAIEKCGVVVRDLSREDVMSCEAAIAISSLKIAAPISLIDGRAVAIDSDVRDICSKLRQLSATL
jgi:branched-chain amino acid aminotransferase